MREPRPHADSRDEPTRDRPRLAVTHGDQRPFARRIDCSPVVERSVPRRRARQSILPLRSDDDPDPPPAA